MSTFGKRALNKWDYTHTKENMMRFNKTPIELQLQILEKWYPIGTKCEKWSWLLKKYEGERVIKSYTLMVGNYYNIETTNDFIIKEKFFKMNDTYHPLQLKPNDNEILRILREDKFKRLGI